jgi:hypothetical protein
MTPLEPNRAQLEIFVNALFRYCDPDGVVNVRAFYQNDANKTFRITPTPLKGGLKFLVDVAEDDARRAANDPQAIIFCPPVATFKATAGWHARQEDLLEGPALSLELDQNPRAALATLEHLLGSATLIICSGGEWENPKTGEVENKLHVHWRLKEPASGRDLVKLKELRRLAHILVGGDMTNVPVVHPIRWAGSWHRKSTPRLCEIISPAAQTDNEIDLDIALAALEAVTPAGPGGPQQSTEQQSEQGSLDWSEAFGKIISGEEFHPALTPLSASFATYGVPRTATRHILNALLDNTQTTDPERLKRRDTERSKLHDTVKSAYEKFAATPTSGALFDPWQELIAPPFPVDVLPGVVREYVTAKSTDIGVDLSAMAMATLAACSGAISHHFHLNLKHKGTWWMHPNLWVLLVGRSSWKKSPAIDNAVAPLYSAQAENQRDHAAQLKDYKRKKQANEKGIEEPDPPERYIVNNTTIEKLADLLSRTNRGILVVRDEIAGWVGGMDKYSSGGKDKASSDRAFWLECWKGGPYTYDRVLRGEIFIPNLSTSFIGGVQPGKLPQLQGLTDDGLLQRFLPVLMQSPGPPADTDCRKIEGDYGKLLRTLLKTPGRGLYPTDGAIAAMAELRQHIFNLEQVGGALPEGFEGFVGKLAGFAGALTIILHLVNEPAKAVHDFVDGTVVENVRRLIMNFLLPHAYQFYCLQTGETDRLRKLASFVLLSGLARIRAADLSAKVWDCRGKTVQEINDKVSPLVAGGWLTPDPGPECRSWVVNRVAIDEQFAARMASVRDSRAAFAQLLRARA